MDGIILSPLALAITITVLSLVSFFLSAAETSIIGLSKLRLRHMVAQGIKRAEHLQRLVLKLDKVIATILVGNNFVNISLSAIITAVSVQLFGYRWGVVLATFTSTFFVLIFLEITPKILATKRAERIALLSAPVMDVLIQLLRPLTVVLIGISSFILKLLGISTVKRSPLITEEELRTMIEIGRDEGVLSEEERRMFHRIFEFGDTRVAEVMVPQEKIIAVNITATAEEALTTFVEEGHARLPVYRDTKTSIVGILYARDLLYLIREKRLFVLQDIVHPAYYVAGQMRVNELLKRFQADKVQIAVVVNQKHEALGLVTLEDLIEEIVGEIDEEEHAAKHRRTR